jgi:protein-lysine N-methyltransferase EEF2KMT
VAGKLGHLSRYGLKLSHKTLFKAGFTLAEWCLENRQHLVRKTVLELGSGSGFTGLVVAAACEANEVFLTDGHSRVVDQLRENVLMNALETKFSSPLLTRATLNGTEISVMKLEWENVDTTELNAIPDLILAAGKKIALYISYYLTNLFLKIPDIVYDPSVFSALKKTLLHFLALKEEMFAIMACTLRNKDTLVELFEVLGANVKIEEEKIPTDKYFVYNNEFPVIIYKLSYNKMAT